MLRWLPLIALFPTLAMAEDIHLSAPVTKATIHPYGATLQRQVRFQVPAGQHRVILSDLPEYTPIGSVRVSLDGARLGTVTLRDDALVPRDLPISPELQDARAEVQWFEDEIAALKSRKQSVLLPVAASEAIATYLSQLGAREGDGDIETLRQTARMIGEETSAARQAALEARMEARDLTRQLTEMQEALDKALEKVAALERGEEAYLGLTAALTAETDGEAVLTLDYVIDDAQWVPVYDIHLTRDGTPSLTLQRGAYVMQETGEDWTGIELLLSTARPLSQTEPSYLHPQLRWIEEPQPVVVFSDRRAKAGAVPMEEPMAEMAVAAPVSQLDGISVTYGYPEPVDIASGADKLRLAFGEVTLEPEVFARAIPQLDETAYVMADFTNTSGEIILPSGSAFFYLDGQFTGTHSTKLIANGDEAEFSFGAIEGVRLTDTVLSRNEGDRGVINKSNEKSEIREFLVENLTGKEWDLRLQGRVPYSEQEDLVIHWQARPEPQVKNVDGRRGILEWQVALAPQSKRKIRLEHRISWPDGMDLR